MKTLDSAEKGEKLEITKLTTKGDLKQRLISFGIIKGSYVEVLEYSPSKSTIEIKIGKTRVALRAEEAKTIEVKSI